MKTLYLDCASGISGDMTLGALLDLGANEGVLKKALNSLPCANEFRVLVQKTQKYGLTGTHVKVRLVAHPTRPRTGFRDLGESEECDATPSFPPACEGSFSDGAGFSHDHDHGFAHGHDHSHDHDHPHDHPHDNGHASGLWEDPVYGQAPIPAPVSEEGEAHQNFLPPRIGYTAILAQIDRSAMSPYAKSKAKSILEKLALAESHVHGVDIEEVHFHEIGAVDTIVDICGAVVLLENLDVGRVIASPVNLGGGRIMFSHGSLGVPAPAVARLLENKPIYGDIPSRGELTTPTGAAILAAICDEFAPMPPMYIAAQGCGFGTRDTGMPNALRAYLGVTRENKAEREPNDNDIEQVCVLETTIDDMTGEALAFAAETLRDSGALEVYFTSVSMKKNRPAVKLTVICELDKRRDMEMLVFRHTSTLGIRCQVCERSLLGRHTVTVETQYGPIRVKCAQYKGEVIRCKPEFDDCSAAAIRYDQPLHKVYENALEVYRKIRKYK